MGDERMQHQGTDILPRDQSSGWANIEADINKSGKADDLKREKQAVNDAYKKTAQVVGDTYDKTAQTVSEKYEQTKAYSSENPSKTIFIALGIGVGLGFIWGSSTRHIRTGRLVRPIVSAVSDVALQILR